MKTLFHLLLAGFCCFFTSSPVYSQCGDNQCSNCGNNDDDPGGECEDCITCPATANSFDAYTGNEFRKIKDLEIWGSVGDRPLVWMRYANSRFGFPNGSYGNAHFWSSSFIFRMYEEGVAGNGQPRLTIIFPDGKRVRFTQRKDDPAQWLPPPSVKRRLFQNGNSFTLQMADGYRYLFEKLTDNSGKTFYQLQFFLDPYQNKYTLSYTNNLLSRITEPAGRYLQITYGVFSKKTVITKVSASDGRSVQYRYKVIPDSTTNWVALDSVYYGDNTKAGYEYTQLDAGVHPKLSHAIDPRVEGAATNIRFTYNTAIAPGFILNERNGLTGEVMATLTIGGDNRVVCYANGKTETFNLPASSRGIPRKRTNGLGEQTTYQYHSGGQGFLKSFTDALNRTTTIDSVTIYGNPIRTTHPDGKTEKWTRDDLDLVLTHTDELGRVTTYTRDNRHRVTAITYPDGTSEQFTYNNFGQVLTRTRRNKGVEKYVYDSRGLKTSFTDALGNVTTYLYDAADRLASLKDARGNSTRYAYDDRGQLTRQIFATGDSTSMVYDAAGNRISSTDELNHVTNLTYDEFRRPVTMTDALGRTARYSYDLPGGTCGCSHERLNPTKIILPSGKTTTIEYDVEWRMISRTEGAGTADAATTFYQYDMAGRLVSTIDPNGQEWKTEYDKRNRRTAETDPLGHKTQWMYDAVGNVIRLTRADGGFTTYTYDAMDRVTRTTDPKKQTTQFAYDAEDNLVRLTDPRGQAYRFTYDLLERKIRMIYPDNRFEGYSYDSVSNLVTYTARAGQVRTYEYDSRNREIRSSWTSPFSGDVTPEVRRFYDKASRLDSVISSVSKLLYTYNNANELISETQNIAGSGGGRTVSYTYNADGLRQSMTYPNGTMVNYTYTARNQVAAILDGNQQITSYTYDYNGNRTEKSLQNGTAVHYAYDAASRMLLLDNKKGGVSFARFDYGYDSIDRRTFVKRDNSKGDVYRYDAIDQITNVLYEASNPETANPTGADRTTDYDWDPSGNRNVVTDNGAPTPYTTNNMNQYTGVGALVPTYFRNANLQTFDGWSYGYDAQNRMKSASNGTTTVSFAYDGQNRCVKRTINGKTTFFYYDEWSLIEERSSSGTLQQSYVHGAMTDELLRKVSGTDSVYYQMDALGSVVRLTNKTGNVIEQYSYDVFGSPTIKNSSGNTITASAYKNRFLFTGREYIQEIVLYDYRNRMYSAGLGRFLQTDPVGFYVREDKWDFNLYRYVFNNPVNWIDPFGLQGTLTIHSSGTSGLGNHSWISFKPDRTGVTTTYGTWGNNPRGMGDGLHENLEAGRGADATRTMHLTAAQEAELMKVINQYKNWGEGAWTYGHPCSSFAATAWNKATGENISPFGWLISNPTDLTTAITKANGGVANATVPGAQTGSSSSSSSSFRSSSGSSVTSSGKSSHALGSF